MNEQIKLLKAEIFDSSDAIATAYAKLNEVSQQDYDEDTCILIAYHLHVIYGKLIYTHCRQFWQSY